MDPETKPDLIAKIPPIPEEVRSMAPWDRIALIHGIEHFYFWEARQLIQELRPLLAADGILILEQPDISVCAAHMNIPAFRDGIYGDSAKPTAEYAHRYGYTPATLVNMVRDGGFSRIVYGMPLFHNVVRDFRLEAQP